MEVKLERAASVNQSTACESIGKSNVVYLRVAVRIEQGEFYIDGARGHGLNLILICPCCTKLEILRIGMRFRQSGENERPNNQHDSRKKHSTNLGLVFESLLFRQGLIVERRAQVMHRVLEVGLPRCEQIGERIRASAGVEAGVRHGCNGLKS